jgi:hypothetical protein
MTKFLKLLLFIISLTLLLGSCKKLETITEDKGSRLKPAIVFLKQKQTTVSRYQAKKIDTLLQNLLIEDLRVITLGETDLILCDLKTYKNVSNPGFKHTYYKMSFPMKDGKITAGLIYTIHTNLSKQQVDKDIQNILLVKSKEFTGEIVTNSWNDRFIQASFMKEGRLEKTYDLQMKAPDDRGQVNMSMSSSDCTAYFLVTTTYYSDGHVERDWEYLYTLCGPCNTGGQPVSTIVPDCDPNSGGGGGGSSNTVETDNISESASEEDETYSAAPRIRYNYHATITRVNGEVTGVVVDPTTVSNPVSWYVDNYGRNTTRTITLFGHSNSWTSLGTTALINWSCFVHGRYVYGDGVSPVYTRQWSDSKSAVR